MMVEILGAPVAPAAVLRAILNVCLAELAEKVKIILLECLFG